MSIIKKLSFKLDLMLLAATVVIICILPFRWLPIGYQVNSEDQGFMNYNILIAKSYHAWTTFGAYGNPASPVDHDLIIPNGYFYLFFEHIGLSADLTQKLFLSAIMFALCISFYLFAGLFTKKRYVILLALLSYVFNFYVASSITFSAKMFQLILTPLLFHLTYSYLRRTNVLYVALHFITFFIFQGIFTNLTQLLSLLLVYPIALMYFHIKHKVRILSSLTKCIPFFFILLPIFLYHYLTYYYSLVINLSEVIKSVEFSALLSPVSKLFQIRGVWWEGAIFDNIPYDHWAGFYNSPYVIFVSYIYVITILYIFLLGKKLDKVRIYFLSLFIFYFALASGTKFIPSIYSWLYHNTFIFSIFREPWAKFTPGVILMFSIFILIGLNDLSEKTVKYKVVYILLLITILIRSFPFYTSSFFDTSVVKWKTGLTSVPSYWLDYQKWSLSHKNATVLPIPFFETRFDFQYDWYKKRIGNTNTNMAGIFSATRTFRYLDSDSNPFYFYKSLSNRNFSFINQSKIDYVLVQNDVKSLSNKNKYSWQKEEIQKYIEDKPFVNFSNKLYVYRLKKNLRINSVYAPATVVITESKKNIYKKGVFSSLPKKSAIIINQDNNLVIKKILGANIQSLPTISYRKISLTKYIVNINNASKNFLLVLNETYNPNWVGYLHNSKEMIDESKHLLSNNYANSWIVEPNLLCDNKACLNKGEKGYSFKLVLEYKPESMFNKIFTISLFMFIVSFSYVFTIFAYSFHKEILRRLT